MRGLAGKGVLVSGGSSGIGEAAARRFLEEGARVHLWGHAPGEVVAAVEALRPIGDVTGEAADITQEAELTGLVERAAARLGAIDVLANNAGVAWREPFLDITAAHWDRVMGVNLRGMFLVAQAVSRQMIARGRGGVIVNMSSTNGLAGEAEYAHYNASKAGVLGLTRTMAVELGRHGIRVNALCPGYIDTPLNAGIVEQMPGDDFIDAYVRDHIPLGRIGLPAEVAAAYAFLASDDAAFIHGSELVIDGGQLTVM